MSNVTGPTRQVRDRDVILLGVFVVAVVLGAQALGIVFPALGDATDNPPTIIVVLVAVTLFVLLRIGYNAVRRR